MKIKEIESFIANVPYKHRENSSRVNRDGVTEVIVKMTTEDGLVGWGECCSGADVLSIQKALESSYPIILGRNPWNRHAIASDFFMNGLWDLRAMTGNYVFAGIDMALWDLCGKAAGIPLYQFFGGIRRQKVNYFWYLSQDTPEGIRKQCQDGIQKGYHVFYLKTGVNFEAELKMVEVIRQTIGSQGKIRVDSNGAWSVNEATRYLAELDRFKIDFAEQPVAADPIRNMQELKTKTPVALCSNEGLWTVSDTWEVIHNRVADVINFSAYWVGSLSHFHHLSHAAHYEGIKVCKHTHGEMGIAAAAHQHILLTLPNIVEGQQQTASVMDEDILVDRLPIHDQPYWGIPQGAGLGIEVDELKLKKAMNRFEKEGQYMPYQKESIAQEEK